MQCRGQRVIAMPPVSLTNLRVANNGLIYSNFLFISLDFLLYLSCLLRVACVYWKSSVKSSFVSSSLLYHFNILSRLSLIASLSKVHEHSYHKQHDV